MNIYFKELPFAPVLGDLQQNVVRFAAKWSAICRKIQCVLVLNAVCFGAKCSVFWYKTQGVLVLNAVQNAAKCEPKSINIRSNGINTTCLIHEKHD